MLQYTMKVISPKSRYHVVVLFIAVRVFSAKIGQHRFSNGLLHNWDLRLCPSWLVALVFRVVSFNCPFPHILVPSTFQDRVPLLLIHPSWDFALFTMVYRVLENMFLQMRSHTVTNLVSDSGWLVIKVTTLVTTLVPAVNLPPFFCLWLPVKLAVFSYLISQSLLLWHIEDKERYVLFRQGSVTFVL